MQWEPPLPWPLRTVSPRNPAPIAFVLGILCLSYGSQSPLRTVGEVASPVGSGQPALPQPPQHPMSTRCEVAAGRTAET